MKLLKMGDPATLIKNSQHTWDNGNPRVRPHLSQSKIMISSISKLAGSLPEVASERLDSGAEQYGIVPVEVNLPFEFQVTTGKLLDAILALSPPASEICRD